MELGIVDMLLSHLRADKAPLLTPVPRPWQLDADFANLSLVALGNIERFLDDPKYRAQSLQVLNAWPGIFKWCAYIYDARIASVQKRNTFSNSMSKVLYTLCIFNKFVQAMIATPRCLELVTKLWTLEDDPAQAGSIIFGLPTGTLGTMMKCAVAIEADGLPDRLVEAAGGGVDFVVTLALRRFKNATKAFNPQFGALVLTWHIDLIIELCRPLTHALRRTLFDRNVITLMTRSFAMLSQTIAQNPTPNCVLMMGACINFFSHFLEGDDYLSLVRTVKAGFLAAFLDCSPVFHRMDAELVEWAFHIIGQILPRYLVYRSFIEAVILALKELGTPHYKRLIAQPEVQAVWSPFLELLAKRMPTLTRMYKRKTEGKRVNCGYVKVRRPIAPVNAFI
jgi:hypothetical protein